MYDYNKAHSGEICSILKKDDCAVFGFCQHGSTCGAAIWGGSTSCF